MRLEIDIPEHHYNNIMALDSVSLGRVPYKGIIMYTINAIKHGKVLEQEPQTFEWCTDCKEYDQEKHCCHRWSKAIRDTVEELKEEYIERDVLDKIITEVEIWRKDDTNWSDIRLMNIEDIIDKYKAETEAEDGNKCRRENQKD